MTTLTRQFRAIKAQHDSILMFRVAGTFAAILDDAALVGEVLGREHGERRLLGECLVACTVPLEDAEAEIGRLVAAGHRVAICEQIGS